MVWYQMKTKTSRRPRQTTKVRLRKASMDSLVRGHPSRRWMISTRRFRARFCGSESG
jgi:hypothetical protein